MHLPSQCVCIHIQGCVCARDTEQSKERMHNHTLVQDFLDYTRNFITCLPGVPVQAIFVEQIDLAAYLIPHQFHISPTSREIINDS